jgi:hypothetical protein
MHVASVKGTVIGSEFDASWFGCDIHAGCVGELPSRSCAFAARFRDKSSKGLSFLARSSNSTLHGDACLRSEAMVEALAVVHSGEEGV